MKVKPLVTFGDHVAVPLLESDCSSTIVPFATEEI